MASECFSCHRVPETPLLRCARCKGVSYCGQACQRAHWPAHKAECNFSVVHQFSRLEKSAGSDTSVHFKDWLTTKRELCGLLGMELLAGANRQLETHALLIKLDYVSDGATVSSRFQIVRFQLVSFDELQSRGREIWDALVAHPEYSVDKVHIVLSVADPHILSFIPCVVAPDFVATGSEAQCDMLVARINAEPDNLSMNSSF
jgi:hypothetical protein